eukprot:CAMPEP_0197068822 /NCGR_PEP_ID=MMETSP1384-20130603/189209_1 /TAXON_ID=29189 /ORGANISM="Ammonia sp." /LENGTH=122 /DNA_ID=CAMNT_0042506687 /DNA_START=84 /DNA_END=452 /DNA_ORIENTATION=-
MLYHKIWKCKRVAKAYRQKEIDKRVQKFFVYHPYRQTIRYAMRKKNLKEIEEHELNYRLLRYQHGQRLKKISDVHSSLPRFNARCTMTGKDKVHDKWFRISTVPLRHMLRENMIPGWQTAKW